MVDHARPKRRSQNKKVSTNWPFLPMNHSSTYSSRSRIILHLSIQRNTMLIFHGVFNAASIVAVVVETVPIKYAAAYQGSNAVEGYISADFSRVITGSGSCSYATGAISDGQYKLRVQVANFLQTTDTTTLGTSVKITGYLKKDKFGTVCLQIEDVTSIVKISDEKLENVQLKNCFRAPLNIRPPV